MPELLKFQKATLFELIKESDFSPAVFELVSARTDHRQTTGNVIRYKDAKYYFAIHLSTDAGFDVYYTPGDERILESDHADSFNMVCYDLVQWLGYLHREINTPDPWAAMSQYSTLAEVSPATEAPNTPFTFPELEAIWKGLTGIQSTLLIHAESSIDQQNLINSQIEFLVESSKRMGRKDWLLIAIGSLVTICAAMSLSPEIARQIFHQLRNAVDGIVHLVPMLT